METEIYLKSIELANKSKAVIKTKWQENEEQIPVIIFVKENSSIYLGNCSQEDLRKKKKDIDVDYETIKSSLTSENELTGIRYELDTKKMKFVISTQENSDSQSEFREIYVRMNVERVEGDDVIPMTMELIDEMLEMSKLRAILKLRDENLNETLKRYEKLQAEKLETDNELLPKFMALLNTKKVQIAKLERKANKNAVAAFNTSNKFLNLSSDLDQSDISSVQDPRSTPLRNIFSSQEEQSSEELQPSTSAAAYNSPARTIPNSKNTTPKSAAKSQRNTPKSAAKSQRRRTPRKASTLEPKGLFQFTKHDTDDSDDKLPSPRKLQTVDSEKFLKGLTGMVRVTRKLRSSQEENPSSVELLAPRLTGRKRLNSSSSEASVKSRQEFCAQTMESDDDSKPLKRQKTAKFADEVVKIPEKDNEIFTQDLTPDIDDDVVQSSQPADSPSIFESYAVRIAKKTPTKASQAAKKSVFSVDTQSFFNDSP